MTRTAALTAAGTVLAATAAWRLTHRTTTGTGHAVEARPAESAGTETAGPWGELPCPPLREGVGYLHDWRASGEWTDPTEVLEVLRRQAPVRLVADLLRDLQTDLHNADHPRVAEQLHDAEPGVGSDVYEFNRKELRDAELSGC